MAEFTEENLAQMRAWLFALDNGYEMPLKPGNSGHYALRALFESGVLERKGQEAPAQGSTGQRDEADALPYAGMVYSQFDPKQHTTHIVGLDKQTVLLERIAGTVERSELLADGLLAAEAARADVEFCRTHSDSNDVRRAVRDWERIVGTQLDRVRELREEARRGS